MDQLEGTFYDYMHQLGQIDPEWTRDVLSFYITMFTGCHRVLDIGCGEGQFIQLLQGEGVKVLGIDSDTRMVEVCHSKGLEVVQADLFDYLPQHEGQFDGIFSSNLIEHLSAQDAAEFIQACYRALSAGGTLVIATPDPASLIVQLNEFWRDATHVRLYNRPLLEFLLHWAGFADIESGEHPHTIWTPPPAMQGLPRMLDEISAIQEGLGGESKLSPTWPPAVPSERSWLHRVRYSLRRRLAQFLAQTVLFEEFASLRYALHYSLPHTLRDALHPIEQAMRALYDNQAGMLLRARESYARGIKPTTGTKEKT